MKFLDARRLTGPSLLFDGPGAILDVCCTSDEAGRLVPAWKKHVRSMWTELGWTGCKLRTLQLSGGVSLVFTAPIDALYAAAEINEWAWAVCDSELNDAEAPDFAQSVADIRASIAEEANQELMRLQKIAAEKCVTLLWDDDEVSLGLGESSRTWPVRELPDPNALDWDAFEDVPIGLVTGTNGKTTTVRLAAHILRGCGRNVGLSSTDWMAVNDHVIDRGDWSGSGGARTVLRHEKVDAAILETARGGLLRRGLGVQQADAALITNIAEDHIGDFGSRNLGELLNIKWIVSRAVSEYGKLLLNADDRLLVDKAGDYPGELVWFGLNAHSDLIQSHMQVGGAAFVLDGDELLMIHGTMQELICRSHEIAITLDGAARHNIANALAAAALSCCLGAPLADIRVGLTSITQDNNPGRCNVYEIDGRKVLVDFAHNPHAMQALFDMARALPAKRRVLCFGQAGDRPDDLVREMTRDAWAIGLDRVIVSELAVYHRGREAREIYKVIRDELMLAGATAESIEHHDEELDSLAAAIDWAEPGDLVIMLALGGAVPIQEQLHKLGAKST